MGSRKTNARGRQLQELFKEGFIECVNDDSTTFEKNDYEEKLDWILASQPLLSFISNVETHPTRGTQSGHKPLTFDIPIGVEPKPPSPRLSLNFKAANWPKFRSKLNEQLMLWNNNRLINSALDIQEYASFITNSITSATQEAIPTSKQLNANIKPSEATKHLIQLKHKTYRKWKKTGEDSEKQQYYKYKTNKDKQHPSSYRPISLLSCLGKLLEKIIKQRLMVILERRNIMPEHQAGFRPRKSTLNNIIRLTKYAQQHMHSSSRRRHAAVILFDIKAAFDSVWHDGLIYKLNELRLPQYLTNYLISFLQNRTAAIEIENILSRPFNLNSGTPQGSPLSPLLYIIYTADSVNGIPEHTEHGLFADDTALWTSSNTITSLTSRLQQSIDEFQSWCNSWKLKPQPSKTELVHFTVHPCKKFKNPISVKIDDTIVKTSNSTRYLGVIIDKTLNWRAHIHHIETKIAGRISLLRFLNRAAYEPNDKIMLNIFKSIARTIIIYGYPILLTANNKIWERLQIMQNKAIRAALGLPIYTSVEYIHRITNIPKIKQYAVTLLQRYIQTATSNNDNVLRNNLQEIFNNM
ncbi:unnamed protein product [Rotaria sp. Silwood1]|nr:unnamed protein product [Rotaria sp. Silwood1]CAF1516616.1 unnamed protein product [Rotaria sp. Silwood1]